MAYILVVCGGRCNGERLDAYGQVSYGSGSLMTFGTYADAAEYAASALAACKLSQGEFGTGAVSLSVDEVDTEVDEEEAEAESAKDAQERADMEASEIAWLNRFAH